jgi:hypothetical protein
LWWPPADRIEIGDIQFAETQSIAIDSRERLGIARFDGLTRNRLHRRVTLAIAGSRVDRVSVPEIQDAY